MKLQRVHLNAKALLAGKDKGKGKAV